MKGDAGERHPIPVINTNSGYVSAGGFMGLFMKSCSTFGALTACCKSLEVGRIFYFGEGCEDGS